MKKMLQNLFKTDSLPILGGSAAAIGESFSFIRCVPTLEQCIHIGFVAGIGALVGYFVKKLLDWAFRKDKPNFPNNKIEYRDE